MAHFNKFFPLFSFFILSSIFVFSSEALATTTAKFDLNAGAEAFFSPYIIAGKILVTIVTPTLLIYLARHSAPLLKGGALFISSIIILFLWFVL